MLNSDEVKAVFDTAGEVERIGEGQEVTILAPLPALPLPPPPSPLSENAAVVYLASLAPGSRRTMSAALERMARLLTGGQHQARDLPWGDLRFSHTAAIRSQLAEQYAPATANKMLSALRGVLKVAWRLGQIEAGEYQKAIDIPAILGESLPAGRSLAVGELVSLMQICGQETGPIGARDSAIVALL